MNTYAKRLTYTEQSKDSNIWKNIDLNSRRFAEKMIGKPLLRHLKRREIDDLIDKIDASLVSYADLSLEIDLAPALNLPDLLRKVLDIDVVFQGNIDITDYDKNLIVYSLTRKSMLNERVVDEFLLESILRQNDQVLSKVFQIYVQFAVDLLRNLFIAEIRDGFIVGWTPRFGKLRDFIEAPIAFAPCLTNRKSEEKSRIYEELFDSDVILPLDERRLMNKKTKLLDMILDKNSPDHQVFKLAFPKSSKNVQHHSVKRFLLEELQRYRKNAEKLRKFGQRFTILRRIFGRNRVVYMEKLKNLLNLKPEIVLDKKNYMEYVDCLNPKLFAKLKCSSFCQLSILRLILQTYLEIQKKLGNIPNL